MHRRWKLGVTAALLAMLALTGCVRTEADLTVTRANTVSGTIQILGQLADESEASQQAVVTQVTTIENRALPGLRDLTGVTAAAVSPEAGWYGTELVLDAVPIASLMIGETQLITRDGDDFLVAGTLDATGQPETPVAAAEGERPAGAVDSVIRLTLTFPGDVLEVRGSQELATFEGSTVTWSAGYDTLITLDATAAATSSAFPEWTWKALVWGAGILVALALVGLVTVAVRSRHDG